ncbi:putative pentatricopeptide repeat-containing protein [Vitis vinifera]|uniref:Putative pentatricopeptide repeat-containing protein n=1 Tax=Vitis vinifera TaxID=29760 RepID=A0A438JSN8_VITVI|nr:putative pentatricopeptide repeat-containing protein [Vitis vinifera]
MFNLYPLAPLEISAVKLKVSFGKPIIIMPLESCKSFKQGLQIHAQTIVNEFGYSADEFTFVALFSVCSVLNEPNVGKQIHAQVYKNLRSIDSNILLKSAIVDMYAKCGLINIAERVFSTMGTSKSAAAWSSMVCGYARCGEINVARKLFNHMHERDVISWTAMISGYSQAGQCSEALELFKEMEALGIKPDEVTLVAVLSACARLGAFDLGKRLYHQYIEMGWEEYEDRFVFNSMIAGLAQHGLGETAITVFRELISTGLKPDEVTFVGVLCACGHSGLIEEGKKLFESMFNAYGIKPQMEHYGCMVIFLDGMDVWRRLMTWFRKMPFEANSVIWRALLSACRTHGNVKIGEIAGQKLLEMEAQHGARYVLLSNILADANQWEEARQVRKVMEDHGIRKPPGWSYIELGGAIHRFVASDKSHPQGKEIELMLKDMAMRLKSAGYVPNTAQVMFDIDEEEKESVVSYHSEKIGFGIWVDVLQSYRYHKNSEEP